MLTSLLLMLVVAGGCQPNLPDGLYAVIDTARGPITISLEYEKVPMTVTNFVGLAEGTLKSEQRPKNPKYYDGLKFHRVVADFMIQGGCPFGDGRGDPGWLFPDEFHPDLKHDKAGTVSMANSGPDSNGSQFFITHKETPWLDNRHTVFGHVVTGQEVVNQIKQGDLIKSVKIYRIGAKARAFKADKETFDKLVADFKAKRDAEAQKQKELAFEQINKEYPNAQKTNSGLMYIVLKKGSGTAHPVPGLEATVHYTGKLLDGTIFDSTYQRNQPAKFPVGSLIPGWNEALQQMTKGEKRIIIIPPELGYGAYGTPGGPIPPNAFLVFEMELINF
jgi:peptidylprolyl isomerase